MSNSPQLAPFNMESTGCTQRFTKTSELLTPSLQLSPETLEWKLLSAVCIHDSFANYPELVRVGMWIDWSIDKFAFWLNSLLTMTEWYSVNMTAGTAQICLSFSCSLLPSLTNKTLKYYLNSSTCGCNL